MNKNIVALGSSWVIKTGRRMKLITDEKKKRQWIKKKMGGDSDRKKQK